MPEIESAAVSCSNEHVGTVAKRAKSANIRRRLALTLQHINPPKT